MESVLAERLYLASSSLHEKREALSLACQRNLGGWHNHCVSHQKHYIVSGRSIPPWSMLDVIFAQSQFGTTSIHARWMFTFHHHEHTRTCFGTEPTIFPCLIIMTLIRRFFALLASSLSRTVKPQYSDFCFYCLFPSMTKLHLMLQCMQWAVYPFNTI